MLGIGMDFRRPTLDELEERVSGDLLSKLSAVSQTPRHNLIDILGKVDSGNYHLLYGDLQYLARQIFADSADQKFLKAHWADRVPQRLATQARGNVIVSASPGTSIPQGLIISSESGGTYYLDAPVAIGDSGVGSGYVIAVEPGPTSNVNPGVHLRAVSDKPLAMQSDVIVDISGIYGGVAEESPETYRSRCLAWGSSTARYGRRGDFVAWAIDASAEVSKAWEIKNYSVFGALLIQVVGGTHEGGIVSVAGLRTIYDYIEARSPYISFTVRTPELVALVPTIKLPALFNTVANRSLAIRYLQTWLEVYAKPEMTITQADLARAINDGGEISGAEVTLPGGQSALSALQYPVLGAPTWG